MHQIQRVQGWFVLAVLLVVLLVLLCVACFVVFEVAMFFNRDMFEIRGKNQRIYYTLCHLCLFCLLCCLCVAVLIPV